MLCTAVSVHPQGRCCGLAVNSGVAKPRYTRARARATFACALAFACRSFKLAPHTKESARDRKRHGSEGLAICIGEAIYFHPKPDGCIREVPLYMSWSVRCHTEQLLTSLCRVPLMTLLVALWGSMSYMWCKWKYYVKNQWILSDSEVMYSHWMHRVPFSMIRDT